jgi:catechol 2,3-dioxygenase-like lactoylglutathione lyase family enzyme
MFDHIGVGVSDLNASKAFFLRALFPLSIAVVMEFSHAAGLGRAHKPSLWLGTAEGTPLPLHIAFAADNRSQVDEFYRQAPLLEARTTAPPGIRPHYHANYYAAFVIGPDGHNIEVVCHRPEAM